MANSRASRVCHLIMRLLLLVFSTLLLFKCAAMPPSNVADACQIFEEKRDWYDHVADASEKWGAPKEVILSIINQESSFVAKARPARRWLFGFIPLGRPSDAYGYAQALDVTWRRYQQSAGRAMARRNRFEDAADFVAWYARLSNKECGIAMDDAYNQYLAYHEGQTGFRRGSYKNKQWLMRAARRVADRAATYRRQLNGCEQRFKRKNWLLELFSAT